MPASEEPVARRELPRVTLVTPTYNQAEYLAETIDSVLNQDYPNIEYIVIDDGSTDDTRAVLEQYDGRIHWLSQENCGQAATLNKGWGMASGEIIGYLSSDDLLKPAAVGESVRFMLKYPEAVLVYPDFELIDARGKHIRDFGTPDYSAYDLRVNLICQPGPGALFWRRHFDSIGGWNPNLRQIPDFEYWLRLSQCGEFRRLPRVLACSRIHESSQSFRALSIERAMEPVNSMTNLTRAGKIHFSSRKLSNWSMASAHVLAFRMLFRSGYFGAGIGNLVLALRLRPGLLARASVWRVIGSTLLAKSFYRTLFKT